MTGSIREIREPDHEKPSEQDECQGRKRKGPPADPVRSSCRDTQALRAGFPALNYSRYKQLSSDLYIFSTFFLVLLSRSSARQPWLPGSRRRNRNVSGSSNAPIQHPPKSFCGEPRFGFFHWPFLSTLCFHEYSKNAFSRPSDSLRSAENFSSFSGKLRRRKRFTTKIPPEGKEHSLCHEYRGTAFRRNDSSGRFSRFFWVRPCKFQKILAKKRNRPMSNSSNYDQGIQLYEEGRYEEAGQFLGEAVKEKETAEGWNDLATCQLQCARIEEAEQGYRRALAMEPQHNQAAANLGILLASQRRHEEAVPLLRGSIAGVDEPQRVVILSVLALIREENDNASTSQEKTANENGSGAS